MAGSCIEKIGCEKCGSGDGLQVFLDEETGDYNGYCFACSRYQAAPYHDKPLGYTPPTPKEFDPVELEEIKNLPFAPLPSRGLTQETCEYFGVRVGLSQEDGETPEEVYFPIGDRFKVRLLAEKKMWWVGPKEDRRALFGWQKALEAGAKTLFVTEGEYDAMALHQAIKNHDKGTKWAEYNPSIVSITLGAGGAAKQLAEWSKEIDRNWKDVVLVFDEDEAGQEAVKEVSTVLSNTQRCGTLPRKDPNECLKAGFIKGLVGAVKFKAEVPKNTSLVDLTKLFEEAKTPPEFGLSWPWKGMTKLTRGLRFGETIYIGAGVKMGKSELVNTLAVHLIREHNIKVMMAKPEEANKKTAKLLIGKWAGRIFHDPTVEFDEEAYDNAVREFPEASVFGVNLYQHLQWEGLRNEIIWSAHAGCRAVFIDPISNLVRGISAAEANTKLEEIATDLAALAKDLDIMVFIFCHVKAATEGKPHEFGGRVMSHQFHGSRAMMRACHMMLGLEGNKDPEVLEGETVEGSFYRSNTRKLQILEDREYGVTGGVSLYWDHMTGLFNEIKGVK